MRVRTWKHKQANEKSRKGIGQSSEEKLKFIQILWII